MSNNNDEDDNKGKRKERSYLPADDYQNGPNKRLNAPQQPKSPVMGPVQRVSTPVMTPPAMPGFGFGNLQMANPAVDVPQQATTAPFHAFGSTALGLEYPQSQAQFRPQVQYTQQWPQQMSLMSSPRSPLVPAAPSDTQPVPFTRPAVRRQKPRKAPAQAQAQTQSVPPAPLLSEATPGPIANYLSSNSAENLAFTETGGERQEPGRAGSSNEKQHDTPQELVSSQNASSSVPHGQKAPSTEFLNHQAIEAYNFGSIGTPIEINAAGRPGKGHVITAFPNTNMTISTCSGKKGLDTLLAQYAYHSNMGGRVVSTMISSPLMSSRLPDTHQPRQPSTSTENLVSTEKGVRRQTPGQLAAQAQPPAQVQPPPQVQPPILAPAPAPAQAHYQGQEAHVCTNCSRPGHLVGDCVGPPNPIHGDLPACPNCDTFVGRPRSAAGRSRIAADPSAHRFDDCPRVHTVFARLQQSMDRQIAYPDLAALTDDELLMFFRALVVKRVRRVPIRTKLVCWIDILRETARRFHDTDTIVLGNMTPWTKPFSIQQHNLDTPQAKPWDFYDYAAGNTQSLPMGPVEKVLVSLEDFVRNGLPGFPAQIFANSDRK